MTTTTHWDVISLIPFALFASVAVLGVITWNIHFIQISVVATILVLVTEVVKFATWPHLQKHTWLQRPSGARNCGCVNQGGLVGGRAGFPSGHVALAAYLAWKLLAPYGVPGAFVATLFTLLVGIARIQKRCHTVAQVIAGAVFGGVAALLLKQNML